MRDPALQFCSHYIQLSTAIERGDFAAAEHELERMQLTAEELGQPTQRWFALSRAPAIELMRGDLPAAERLSEQRLRDRAGGGGERRDPALRRAARLPAHLPGPGEEIVALLAGQRRRLPGDRRRGGRRLVWCLCWLGTPARQAAERWSRRAADGFRAHPSGGAEADRAGALRRRAAQTGATEAAALCARRSSPGRPVRMERRHRLRPCPHVAGLARSATGDHEQADGHLEFACEFHESNGLPLWAARARLGWAESLAGRGDPRARDHAARALELSREYGYALFEPRAAALLDLGAARA